MTYSNLLDDSDQWHPVLCPPPRQSLSPSLGTDSEASPDLQVAVADLPPSSEAHSDALQAAVEWPGWQHGFKFRQLLTESEF